MIPLPLPTFIPRYLSAKAPGEWSGHVAFGHDLVTAARPSLYVAAGLVSAEEYFGVCQTILENGLACTCYGVLLTQSDDLAANELTALELYNANRYQSFSHLLSSGDGGLRNFSDTSIDILQIADSRSAGHVLEAWLPKVKPGGIVLVNGIAKREPGAEAWRVWEHVEATFPDSFAFHHANGLGVLRKPGNTPLPSSFLESLFNSSAGEREYIRRHYVIYSGYLDGQLRRDSATDVLTQKIGELTTELRAAQHERMILEAELTHKQLELTRAQFDHNTAQQTIAELQESLVAAHSAHNATRIEKQQLTEALQAEQEAKQNLVHSLSWKMTAPMRDFMEWKRRHKAD